MLARNLLGTDGQGGLALADYYPLIARAVAGLPQNTEPDRRALYERARNALAKQLRVQTPALSQSQFAQERQSLEEAIRKVETEASDASKKVGFWKKLFGPSAAKPQGPPKPRGMPQATPVSRDTPAILSDLMKQDWFFLPTGNALVKSDEKTRQFSSSVLSSYKGWLCALCQSVRCDETSTVLVNVTDRKADGNLDIQPVAICEKCVAAHTEGEIIAMGKAGKLCNAVTVANQPQERNLTFQEMNPCPVGVVLETQPRRIIKVGDTLDSMRAYIGEPLFKGTANEWGKFSGNIEIYCYAGGGVFKVPMALIFANGKLATFADYKDS